MCKLFSYNQNYRVEYTMLKIHVQNEIKLSGISWNELTELQNVVL